jgi:hypothetical protein
MMGQQRSNAMAGSCKSLGRLFGSPASQIFASTICGTPEPVTRPCAVWMFKPSRLC